MKTSLVVLFIASALIVIGIVTLYAAEPVPVAEQITVCTAQTPITVQPTLAGQVSTFFGSLLKTDSWPARWQCGTWTAFEGWLYIISDLLIWLSYFAIPVILASFVYRKQAVLPFNSTIFLVVGFILACGLTHFLDALIFWWPAYRLSALARFVTAGVSVGAVFALIKVTPQMLEFRSPEHLEKLVAQRTQELLQANRRLQEEIRQRELAEEENKRLNRELEARIHEKTLNLQELNDKLTLTNQTLSRNQEITSMAIEAGEIGIWAWDVARGEANWNSYMRDHLGFPAEMIKGNLDYFLERVHPDDRQRTEEALAYSLHHPARIGVESRVMQDNGDIHYIDIKWVVSTDDQGKPVELFGVCLNITDRFRLQEILRQSEERFRSAVEHSAIGIGLVSLEGRWLQVNRALRTLLGYTEAEMLQLDFQSITHPEDLQSDLALVEELYQGRRIAYQMEKRYIHKSGEIVWIQLNVSLVRDNEGNPLYYISQIQDITDRQRVQQEMLEINANLETRTQKLEALNAELEAFTYSVSHDLRAPLRSIGGYSQILEEDYYHTVDAEGKKVIQAIVRNARKMGRLIDDLLEFSRLGRKELGKGSLDMRVVVEPLLRDMVAAETDRTITYTLDELATVRVDFSMIKQAWTNLIANALKYTRKTQAAHIEIGSYTTDSEVCFYIRDNGIGFNMDYVDKLYGVFQRLHRLDEFEGTGVGLALVKRIINRHGGRVWAEGRENDGATFYFSLPR